MFSLLLYINFDVRSLLKVSYPETKIIDAEWRYLYPLYFWWSVFGASEFVTVFQAVDLQASGAKVSLDLSPFYL